MTNEFNKFNLLGYQDDDGVSEGDDAEKPLETVEEDDKKDFDYGDDPEEEEEQ